MSRTTQSPTTAMDSDHGAPYSAKKDDTHPTAFLRNAATRRRLSVSATSPSSILHPFSRANTTVIAAVDSAPRLCDDVATTAPAIVSPLLSAPQRSPHYLPELNFAEDPRDVDSTTGMRRCSSGPSTGSITVSSPPSMLSEGKAKGTPTLHTHTRRLSPLSPLALPSSSSTATTTSTTPTAAAATAATPHAPMLKSPKTGVTVPTLPQHDRVAVSTIATAAGAADAYGAPRVLSSSGATRTASAKVTSFEQRRIPLPPPAVVANAPSDAPNNAVNSIVKSSSNSSAVAPLHSTHITIAASSTTPSSSATAAAIPSPTRSSGLVESVKPPMRGDGRPRPAVPRTAQRPPTPLVERCTSASSDASSLQSRGGGDDDSQPHSPASPSVLVSVAGGTAPRTTLFSPVAFGNAAREEHSGTALDAINGRAPTSLRHRGAAQLPLPPMPPTPTAASSSKKADLADREQAQMVRDLLQWRRCGRPRQLLLRTCNADDLRCDVQPITVQPSRLAHMLGSEHACLEAEGEREAAATRLPPKTLEMDKTLSAIEIVTPPVEAAATTLRRTNATASRGSHGSAEEAARLQDASPTRLQQPQSPQQHHSRHASLRSHPSIISRCSSPDGGSADGGSSGGAGSGVHFRKSDASPKHGSNAGALRRSLPSDRLFTRPSSTSLTMDAHREGSGWSRGEAGGPWGGSSRHMNLSTLTISCAPALGSFSTNSDSSLFP